MQTRDELNAVILAAIVRDYPKAFWEEARGAIRQAYLDVFHQIDADPNILVEQRLDALYQARHFRMESLLKRLAERHSIPASATLLKANNRSYVYVTKGAIGLTQAYVPTIGAMPKPARFRERHAQMNAISLSPQFDFGNEPREAFLPKDFYGLVAHNPIGNRFKEKDQRLGMIQFCVPFANCTMWAAELSIEEILAAYDAAAPAPKPMRGEMQWKKITKKDEGEA